MKLINLNNISKMSIKISNIIFKSSASNSSVSSSGSSNSAAKVDNIIKEFDEKCIHSCVIGISSIRGSSINHNIAHSALLLSEKKANDLERKGGTGILIEYGDYTPNLNEDEKNYVKNGYVIYRYGEQGGLRYYVHYFDEFKTTFCDIGYLCLDVSEENQITFSAFIDKIAPKYENNWIQKNYNAVGILNKTLNCQTFTSFVLDFLRPSYDNRYITKGPSAPNEGNNESIIPNAILNILKKYED